jgi:hypothetical protein
LVSETAGELEMVLELAAIESVLIGRSFLRKLMISEYGASRRAC